MVAIGGHSGWARKVGAVDFGPDAPFDENAIMLDWYDYLFMGKQNKFANGKPVKIFVMGENKWRDEELAAGTGQADALLPALRRQGEQRCGRWAC